MLGGCLGFLNHQQYFERCLHGKKDTYASDRRNTSDRNLIDKFENTLPETNIAPENGWLED